MRNIILALLISIFTFTFMVTDASAKRFGGGKSFGATRQASSFTRPSAPLSAPAAAAAKPASGASKWLGPLAGLAAGGLLASLFMGHGFGSGMMSWLLVAIVAFFVWRIFSSRMQQPATQPPVAQNNMNYETQPTQTAANNVTPFNKNLSFNQQAQGSALPAGFDEATFLRQAKANFIRLQAAYDNKNLADLREFTSPEVFAEIQLQLHERGNEPNQTDVISIDAKLLDVTVEGQTTIASVEFSGSVREEQNAAPVPIKEIWHFHNGNFQTNWVVAGIQQA